ncbi:MAG: hypothetical protein Q9226_003698 [Calogaya cf. arnoldii]
MPFEHSPEPETRTMPFELSPEPETRIKDAYPVQQAQDALPSKKEPFNRDIRIANVNYQYILASALLDTQCHIGNWISRRLVKRLGREHKVSKDYEPPNLTDAGGNDVVACGIIRLHWKWSPHGTRVHECDFLVFPGTPNLDVVFGVDYILSEGLVTVNEKAMYPMTAHQKATPAEKAAIALALEKQKQDKAALDARRIQLQQQQSWQQSQGRQRP